MAIITIITICIFSLLFISLSLIELVPQIKSMKNVQTGLDLTTIQLQNIEDAAVEYLRRQTYLKSLIK